ncbi:MAG: hypothetical protein Q7T03_03695 [Deltaproteobacteria bacterium]|nr:hypothetical protein [Deltaproteobacteria bacterium]
MSNAAKTGGTAQGGGSPPPIEVTQDARGRSTVHLQPEGVASAVVDVYCGTQKRKGVPMVQGADKIFRAGPFDRCANGSSMKWDTHIIGKPSSLPDGGSPVSGFTQPIVNPREGRVERPVHQPLKANYDKSRHYYSRRTRAEGEADLQKMTGTAPKEEGFLFAEGLDAEGKPISYWYEIGEDETAKTNKMPVSSHLIAGVRADFEKLTGMSFYHFHPKMGENTFGAEYPSPTDFEAVMGSAKDSLKMGYPEEVLDDRIVTPTGVYTLHAKLSLIRGNLKMFEDEIVRYKDFFHKFGEVVKRAFDDLPQAEINKNFAKAVSSDFVELTFIPFEK